MRASGAKTKKRRGISEGELKQRKGMEMRLYCSWMGVGECWGGGGVNSGNCDSVGIASEEGMHHP